MTASSLNSPAAPALACRDGARARRARRVASLLRNHEAMKKPGLKEFEFFLHSWLPYNKNCHFLDKK
jgi:hypothetical protein